MRRLRLLALAAVVLGLAAALGGCFGGSNPVAILASAVVSGPAPLDVSFNLSYSEHTRGLPMEYSLAFGDETAPATGTDLDIAVHHTYEVGGTYVAELTLTDDQGARDTDRLTITVSQNGPPIGTDVGQTAPDFTAPTTAGGEVTLSDSRGSVVLLDFWGTWCSPCKRSMPHLDDLARTYGPDGLVVIIVSTDTVEQSSIDYLAGKGYDDFISVWEPGGKHTPVALLYGVLGGGDVGIPHTFLIDKQGVIRFAGHPLLDLTETMIEALL
jgi:peroxiredoxin